MKRFITAAVVLSLAALPGTALARHGHRHHGRHHELRHHHHVTKGKSGTVTAFDSSTGELTITTNKGRVLSALVTADTRLRFETDSDATATASSHGGGDDNSGSGHGGGDHSGPGNSGDDNDQGGDNGDDNGVHNEPGDDNGNQTEPGDDNGNHAEPGDDHGDDTGTAADIAVGDAVSRARIDLDGDDAVWTKLTITKVASTS